MSMIEVLQNLRTFNKDALRSYILRVAQVESGGFRDKPGKLVDFYHTNYALSGLSCCEHKYCRNEEDEKDVTLAFRIAEGIANDERTFTEAVNPVFGIPFSFCKAPLKSD